VVQKERDKKQELSMKRERLQANLTSLES